MVQKIYPLQYKYIKNLLFLSYIITGGLVVFIMISYLLQRDLRSAYNHMLSTVLIDRNGNQIHIDQNSKGYRATPAESMPDNFKKLLLRKEDRFFYFHPGINPGSIAREFYSLALRGKRFGGSTLTQQLVKNLLGNETKRTVKNKLNEVFYALSLELWTTKKTILTMYANTAYFGNSTQGLKTASDYYFDKPPEELTDSEILSLLATLNAPSISYPGTKLNKDKSSKLAEALNKPHFEEIVLSASKSTTNNSPASQSTFELNTLGLEKKCLAPSCTFSIDAELTVKLRSILREHLLSEQFNTADNGAIVIIKLPENELLAIIGSPNPRSLQNGAQINMATRPRAIGSTAKPFFYLKAFEKGLRPYSLIEDKEYGYSIGTGFEFYPKNYDGKYRGVVSVHEALSNSLNVPSVKTLEYAGVQNFADFLTDTLDFIPIQPMEDYSLGIALGGLEMDLVTLTYLYSIFPNQGELMPLIIGHRNDSTPMYFIPPMLKQESLIKEKLGKTVIEPRYIALINKILSDRKSGAEQFGIKSFLNLSQDNYALKTGTSRDYHDSWTVGYTPDFLVGVWIGNSDDTAMRLVSGQSGAGRVWHDAMEVMLNSNYNKNTSFDFSELEEYYNESGSIVYGLPEDDYDQARDLIIDDRLILHPHNGDVILMTEDIAVPLEASREAKWFIDGDLIGQGTKIYWEPKRVGNVTVSARIDGEYRQDKVSVEIISENNFR